MPDRPGWYRDPDGVFEHEAYWDGTNWTGATRAPLTAGAKRATRRSVGTILFILVGGVLALGMLGCATGIQCTYEFSYLWALKSDPMASLDLPGTDLDHSHNTVGGTVLGKPRYSRVTHVYRIVNQAEADDLLGEAVEYAESSGWTIEPSLSQDSYRGRKTLETGRADIFIGLGPDVRESLEPDDLGPDPNGRRVLTVVITDKHPFR